MAIQKTLEENNITYNNLELGEVETSIEPSEGQIENFKNDIEKLGFELIEDRNARIISKIKNIVLSYIREQPGKKSKLSVEISEVLAKDYNSLSNLFSEVEGITIEQFA